MEPGKGKREKEIRHLVFHNKRKKMQNTNKNKYKNITWSRTENDITKIALKVYFLGGDLQKFKSCAGREATQIRTFPKMKSGICLRAESAQTVYCR